MARRWRVVDLRPWQRVRERFEAGEAVPVCVRQMAEEALGVRFVRRATPGQRPDVADLKANDDSFDDDGMVSL